MTTPDTENVETLQAKLRQVDDLVAKRLMRAEEADEARQALRRRLLQAVVPDVPAPRLGWRARAWALAAMALLVASVGAYLLSGRAGLRRESTEILDAARQAAAEREVAREQGFERLRAGKAAAAGGAQAQSADEFASTAALAGPRASPGAGAVAPLLAGRVELAPAMRSRVAPGDAVFIQVRLPGDPAGLPLAALRRSVADLPLDFTVRDPELVGPAARFMQARAVVASARVSRSGSGHPEPGDLLGTSAPVAPRSTSVAVVIDHPIEAQAPAPAPAPAQARAPAPAH